MEEEFYLTMFHVSLSVIHLPTRDMNSHYLVSFSLILLYAPRATKTVLGGFSSVQPLSRVQHFATPWIAACQASLSIISSWSLLKLMSIESVMHPAVSSSVIPFSSCPHSLPASGPFPMTQLFTWGGQSTGVSALASVLSKNTQDWSPLEWAGWISYQSKGLSRVFSNTTVQKHQFFGAQLSSQSNSHIHTWLQEKPQPWLDGP